MMNINLKYLLSREALPDCQISWGALPSLKVKTKTFKELENQHQNVKAAL